MEGLVVLRRVAYSVFLFALSLHLASALALYNNLRPCPVLRPAKIVDLDELLGKWHLAYLILDAASEEYVENSLCVRGELQRLNETSLRQVWNVDMPGMMGEHSAVLDLPTRIVKPAVWTVLTPLGGEVKATVVDTDPKSYMVVSHCGMHHGTLVHLWTGIVTRAKKLGPMEQLQLTSLLIQHGFNPTVNKIITWNDC
nr:PREDICTED: uncharacterized protein LOC109030521 [Bemisia tabaci]